MHVTVHVTVSLAANPSPATGDILTVLRQLRRCDASVWCRVDADHVTCRCSRTSFESCFLGCSSSRWIPQLSYSLFFSLQWLRFWGGAFGVPSAVFPPPLAESESRAERKHLLAVRWRLSAGGAQRLVAPLLLRPQQRRLSVGVSRRGAAAGSTETHPAVHQTVEEALRARGERLRTEDTVSQGRVPAFTSQCSSSWPACCRHSDHVTLK